MPEAGSTTPGPHVMCIISSQRDTYCYESKNDSSTNRSTWSEGLNIEIKIITPNYFKARCKTMTASWRELRRIDNSELSTTLNSCFNMASLSRLIWQLMVHAIATSKGQLWQLFSKLLRRWLGMSLKAFPKILVTTTCPATPRMYRA